MATNPTDKKRVRIPLWVPLTNRHELNTAGVRTDDTLENVEFMKNCFPEVVFDPAVEKGAKAYIIRRAGLVSETDAGLTALSVGAGYTATYACCFWSGITGEYKVAIFKDGSGNNKAWDIIGNFQHGNTFSPGIGSNIGVFLVETIMDGTPTLVYGAGSGSNASSVWYYQDGGSWTQITDSNFPTESGERLAGQGKPVFLNGYMYVMSEDGRVWNSALNDITTWSSTGFISTQTYPDRGVGLARHHNTIAAFQRGSIEFFEDVGNATGSPLQLIKDKTIHSVGGTFSRPGHSIQTIFEFGDDIYFVGQTTTSFAYGIYRLRNFQIEKISNSAIDRLCNATVSGFNDNRIYYVVGSFISGGMTHIAFSNGTLTQGTQTLYCYCPETNTWWICEGNTSDGEWSCIVPFQQGCVLNEISAVRWFFRDNEQEDTTNNFTQTIQLVPLDFGTNKRKFFHYLSIIGDMITASENISISWSDDDGETFTTARTVDMSDSFPHINVLGSSRRRIFKIEYTGTEPLRLEAVELEYTEGVH